MLKYKKMKRLCSIFLLVVMILNLLPVSIVRAADLNKYPYIIYAGGGDIILKATVLTVNGDICTAGVFLTSATTANINGEIKEGNTSGGMVVLHDMLKNKYFTSDSIQYTGNYFYDEMNANINEKFRRYRL